ncbi:MAG: hypothetical protein QUV06_10280 [Cyanobium sp. CZS 48M]|nr:hypothetical protein [Cyanobium sp. CZS48M]
MNDTQQMSVWQSVLEEARRCERRHDWLGAAAVYARVHANSALDPRPLINQGHALWQADLPLAALGCYRLASTLAPDHPLVLCGLGHCFLDLREFEQADLHYLRVGSSEACWARGQVLLGLERYEEAFQEIERRRDLASWVPFLSGTWWGGMALRDLDPSDELLVWSEQGYGDIFQYLRWLPALGEQRQRQAEARGVRCLPLTLVVEPNLVRLLAEGLAWMSRPPRVVAKTALRPEEARARAHGPMISLPHELGGAPLPSGARDGEESVATLRSPLWSRAPRSSEASLLPHRQGDNVSLGVLPRIGLVWASGRKLNDPYTHREYIKRSLPPSALIQLLQGLQLRDVQVVSMQYGNDDQLAAALGFPLPMPRLPLGDFASVARVVAQLDLVISVDTAMAHLVGTMGMPGWILLPWSADPRWQRDRSDTPWYPSLRLFRQPRSGAWSEAIEELFTAFDARFSAAPGC